MLRKNILSVLYIAISVCLLGASDDKPTQTIDSYLATRQTTAQTCSITITKENVQSTLTCFKITARNSRNNAVLLLVPTDPSVIDLYECDTGNRKFLPYLKAQLNSYFCNDLTSTRTAACGYNFMPTDKRTTTITSIFVP